MQGDQNGALNVCFGHSWRSLVCRLDQFFDATLKVSFRPLCRWHDWLLARQFDRDFEDAEPVTIAGPPGRPRVRVREARFIQAPTNTTGTNAGITFTYEGGS